MLFKEIIGNTEIKERLVSMVDNNRVPHAIMLSEEGIYGAVPIALALIQYMSCTNKQNGEPCGICSECNKIQKLVHPDLHFVFPVNSAKDSSKKVTSIDFIKQWRELTLSNPYFSEEELNNAIGIEDKTGAISVADAKSILTDMNTRSYQGGNKYMFILYPEKISTEAANKLLKIIEEPFPHSYFIFVSHSPEMVINTIRSRTLRLQLHPQQLPHLKESENEAQYFAIISNIFDLCFRSDLLSLLSQNDKIVALGREKQKEYCKYFEVLLRKILLSKNGLSNIYNASEQEKQLISKYSNNITIQFISNLFKYLEGARTNIESNVNAKMVFYNLNNLIYLGCNRK